jgi:hypothetical protein
MAIPHDLRVKLHERRNRLYKSDYKKYDNELGFFLDWLGKYEYIRGIITEIEAAPLDFEEWRDGGGVGHHGVDYPDTEIDRAKACLLVMRERDTRRYASAVSDSTHFDEMLQDYTEAFVDPLVDYIEDVIEEGSEVLSTPLRYKRRVEWFEAAELHSLYEQDTTHGEDSLDRHLRRYLLDQGTDFPFSQPRSPSGEADVVAAVGSDDPLSLEVKLFLPDAGKDKAYIRQGFSQAYRYASDYGVPVGYLLAFNLTAGALIFEVQQKRPGSPPAIHVGDKTIFLIGVDTHPARPSASKDRKLQREVITEKFLLEELDE